MKLSFDTAIVLQEVIAAAEEELQEGIEGIESKTSLRRKRYQRELRRIRKARKELQKYTDALYWETVKQ
jgi:hypothetical protein